MGAGRLRGGRWVGSAEEWEGSVGKVAERGGSGITAKDGRKNKKEKRKGKGKRKRKERKKERKKKRKKKKRKKERKRTICAIHAVHAISDDPNPTEGAERGRAEEREGDGEKRETKEKERKRKERRKERKRCQTHHDYQTARVGSG
jgi:hypothetical protein